ncbi:MAG: HEAT repeat domain-containing protein, partial [Spirochaetota bacterium]|nr:HEAT repeat domain-containing protein [Spirochaetota bacterium]
MTFKTMRRMLIVMSVATAGLALSSCIKNNIIHSEPIQYDKKTKISLLELVINKELENREPAKIFKWIKIYYRSSGLKTKKLIYRSVKSHLAAEDLQGLFLELKRKSETSKRLVARFLKKVRTKKILEECAWLMNYPDRFVSGYSVYLLRFISINELLPVFNRVLEEDNSENMQIKIIELLGQKKSWKSIDLLFDLMDEGNVSLKSYGLWAFRQIDTRKTKPFLTLKLKSEDKKEVLKASFLLGELRQKEAIMAMIHQMDRLDKLTRRKLSKNLIKLLTNRTLKLFVQTLKIENPLIQKEIIWLFGESKKKKTIRHLFRFIDSNDSELKNSAILAMVKLGEERVADELLGNLSDKMLSVRLRTIWALGNLHIRKIPEKLIGLLDDKDQKIREFSRWAILHLVSKSNYQSLYKYANNKSLNVQTVALEAIGKVNSSKAYLFLEKKLKQCKNQKLRLALVKILTPHLVRRKVPNYLLGYAKSSDPMLRAAVIRALGHLERKRL